MGISDADGDRASRCHFVMCTMHVKATSTSTVSVSITRRTIRPHIYNMRRRPQLTTIRLRYRPRSTIIRRPRHDRAAALRPAGQRPVLRHCDLMTFDKQSNARRTTVESKSNRSCNRRITDRHFFLLYTTCTFKPSPR